MMEQHSRSGKAHDVPDSLAMLFVIAMNRAIGAERFLVSPRTDRYPVMAVLRQLSAVRTQIFLLVFLPTVKPDHLIDGIDLGTVFFIVHFRVL